MLEIHALDENHTWNLVDLPKGEKQWDVLVGLRHQSYSRWLYGKTRLVAKEMLRLMG